jgi:hypothetical protein
MAKRKPLVLGDDGLPQNLQPGDYIGEIEMIVMASGEVGAVPIGTPVYLSASNQIKKAKADAAGTVPAVAIVTDTSIAEGTSGNIQMSGTLKATTAQWDAVTGQVGGLTPGGRYFLSAATAGMITTAVPATGYAQHIGLALSTTDLLLMISEPIKL